MVQCHFILIRYTRKQIKNFQLKLAITISKSFTTNRQHDEEGPAIIHSLLYQYLLLQLKI